MIYTFHTFNSLITLMDYLMKTKLFVNENCQQIQVEISFSIPIQFFVFLIRDVWMQMQGS